MYYEIYTRIFLCALHAVGLSETLLALCIRIHFQTVLCGNDVTKNLLCIVMSI